MSHVRPHPLQRTAAARSRLSRLVGWARDPGTVHPAAGVARVAAGLVFLGFGPGKFLHHAAEASAFARYGVPFPDVATYAVGTLEIVGGIALIAGLLVRPVALVSGGESRSSRWRPRGASTEAPLTSALRPP